MPYIAIALIIAAILLLFALAGWALRGLAIRRHGGAANAPSRAEMTNVWRTRLDAMEAQQDQLRHTVAARDVALVNLESDYNAAQTKLEALEALRTARPDPAESSRVQALRARLSAAEVERDGLRAQTRDSERQSGNAAVIAPLAAPLHPGADAAEVETEALALIKAGYAPRNDDAPPPPAPNAPVDDLKRLKGVGPKLERMLREGGMCSFRQIADLSARQAIWIDMKLALNGRMIRDRWIAQARDLAIGEAKQPRRPEHSG